MSIPKILHFIWNTEDVPGVMAKYLARWRELHPDWDVTLWTFEKMRAFVAGHHPRYLPIYEAYPRDIQRIDAFRYMVMLTKGGVYSDLDVEPFRSINGLVEGLRCFGGLEPAEHMGPDRLHSGAPFQICNAFMGAVPNHPWFREAMRLLPITAGIGEVMQSTGPGVATAAALRLPRQDRPALVLPAQWSPVIDGGKPCRSDGALKKLLGEAFDFAPGEGAFVAHRWLSTWVPWHKRIKWLAKPFHAMNALKWKWRSWRHHELTRIDIRDAEPYFDQTPKPPQDWPRVAICAVAETKPDLSVSLVDAIAELDYPSDRLGFFIVLYDTKPAGDVQPAIADGVVPLGRQGLPIELVYPPPDRAYEGAGLSEDHWQMLRWSRLANSAIADMRGRAEWVLFIDGGVSAMPPGALKAMLSAQKPVVALSACDGDGKEADRSVFRYTMGGGIRTVYKIRGEDGIADPDNGQRDYLSDIRAFAEVPLDGVGQSFVLVRRDVLEQGIRFAESPYHLHMGGEGLALMARHKGFEATGLTDYMVRK